MKTVSIINIALFMLAMILIINLIHPIDTIVGNLVYSLEPSEPRCHFSNFGELNEIQIDRCCYEIQKQLSCKSVDTEEFDLKCHVSETSARYYLINSKAFNYCEREGYDVKVG